MNTLTPREVEVLALYADGLRPAAIASRANIAVSTVRSNLERLRHKLDANHIAHAVAIGFRTGLLPTDGGDAR